MEKIAFALLVTSRKLRPYFQAHPIVVMTNQPIRKTMNKIDAVGQLIQWAIELGQFGIEYWPLVALKAQLLVDFITEFTYPCKEEEPPPLHGNMDDPNRWVNYEESGRSRSSSYISRRRNVEICSHIAILSNK